MSGLRGEEGGGERWAGGQREGGRRRGGGGDGGEGGRERAGGEGGSEGYLSARFGGAHVCRQTGHIKESSGECGAGAGRRSCCMGDESVNIRESRVSL